MSVSIPRKTFWEWCSDAANDVAMLMAFLVALAWVGVIWAFVKVTDPWRLLVPWQKSRVKAVVCGLLIGFLLWYWPAAQVWRIPASAVLLCLNFAMLFFCLAYWEAREISYNHPAAAVRKYSQVGLCLMGVFILGMVFIWFYLSETWSVALASAASVTCASGMGAMWWCTVRARQAEQVLDLIARSGVFLIVQKSEPVAVSLRQMKKLLAKDGVQAVSWLNLLFVPAVHREHANGLVRRAQVYGWAVLDKEALR